MTIGIRIVSNYSVQLKGDEREMRDYTMCKNSEGYKLEKKVPMSPNTPKEHRAHSKSNESDRMKRCALIAAVCAAWVTMASSEDVSVAAFGPNCSSARKYTLEFANMVREM